MKLSDFIKQCQLLQIEFGLEDPDILISSDSEGNRIMPFHGEFIAGYAENNLHQKGYAYTVEYDGSPTDFPVLVLYPI